VFYLAVFYLEANAMKVAIITAYHQVTPELVQCLKSVQSQSHSDILHITIGDGCDLRDSLEDELTSSLLNVPLPQNIGDIGDTPRALGVIYAKSIGADAVTFLDSDNWLQPNHIESLVNTAKINNSHVVACRRSICHLDGTAMGLCPDSNGFGFCDTNCILITKELFDIAACGWRIPDHLHVIGDRIIWDNLIHATDRISISNHATVNYRTGFAGHYPMFGYNIPDGAKSGEDILKQKEIIDQLVVKSTSRMNSIIGKN
jgi:hypothetical protein